MGFGCSISQFITKDGNFKPVNNKVLEKNKEPDNAKSSIGLSVKSVSGMISSSPFIQKDKDILELQRVKPRPVLHQGTSTFINSIKSERPGINTVIKPKEPFKFTERVLQIKELKRQIVCNKQPSSSSRLPSNKDNNLCLALNGYLSGGLVPYVSYDDRKDQSLTGQKTISILSAEYRLDSSRLKLI